MWKLSAKFERESHPDHWSGLIDPKLCGPSSYVHQTWSASKKSHFRTFALSTPSGKLENECIQRYWPSHTLAHRDHWRANMQPLADQGYHVFAPTFPGWVDKVIKGNVCPFPLGLSWYRNQDWLLLNLLFSYLLCSKMMWGSVHCLYA